MPATRSQTETFLDALFGSAPESLYVLLWTMPNKRSVWVPVSDLGAATKHIKRFVGQNHDVYCGVSLSPMDYGPNARCKAEETAGIVGLWADVDVQSEAHKKKNLPPDREAALALVGEMGIAPSVTIWSGHGLQCWWLFQEALTFAQGEDGNAERAAAVKLVQGWQAQLRRKAKVHGWDVDATHDLARVLRVPGSFNHKSDPPVAVEIIEAGERRYAVEDFEALLPTLGELKESAVSNAAAKVTVGAFSIGGGEPPGMKLLALLENDKKFKDTYERKRRDFQDQSPSVYDMALASYTARAGWTDQEIVNLIVGTRQKYGNDVKTHRSYYENTIRKARQGAAMAEAEEKAAQEAAAIEEATVKIVEQVEKIPAGAAVTDEMRESILNIFNDRFGFRIERIVKYRSDDPIYRVETSCGFINLDSVAGLINQTTFRCKIAAATGVLLPMFKAKLWQKIAQAMLKVCIEEDIGELGSEMESFTTWFHEYISDRQPLNSIEEAYDMKSPFLENGKVCFFCDNFKQWLEIKKGEKISRKGLGKILRLIGADTSKKRAVKANDGKRTTTTPWVMNINALL